MKNDQDLYINHEFLFTILQMYSNDFIYRKRGEKLQLW